MMITAQELKAKEAEALKNNDAAYAVAEYYYGKKDFAQAFRWYEKAASGKKPVPMALYALGYACQMGEGTEIDLMRALAYYEAAAEKNLPQACYNLAYFYQNGLGTKRNPEKADYYCLQASQALKKLAEELQEEKEKNASLEEARNASIRDFEKSAVAWKALAEKNAKAEAKLAETEARLSDVKAQQAEEKKELKGLMATHQALTATLEKQLQKNEALREEKMKCQEQIQAEKLICNHAEGQIMQLMQSKEELMVQLDGLHEKNTQLHREVEGLNGEKEKLEAQLFSEKYKYEQLEKELKSTQQLCEQRRASLQNAEDQAKNMKIGFIISGVFSLILFLALIIPFFS